MLCRYAECCYAEYRYAECRYAECRYAECRDALDDKNLSFVIYEWSPKARVLHFTIYSSEQRRKVHLR